MTRGFDCPACNASEAFRVKAAVGDYVEWAASQTKWCGNAICEACDYFPSQAEADKWFNETFEGAAEAAHDARI